VYDVLTADVRVALAELHALGQPDGTGMRAVLRTGIPLDTLLGAMANAAGVYTADARQAFLHNAPARYRACLMLLTMFKIVPPRAAAV